MGEIPEDIKKTAREIAENMPLVYASGDMLKSGYHGDSDVTFEVNELAETIVKALIAERQRCADVALQEMARFDDVATGTAFRVANAILNP